MFKGCMCFCISGLTVFLFGANYGVTARVFGIITLYGTRG